MVQLLTSQIDIFWRFALRCFVGELGDKTFFVVVLLTAWVATWDGIRDSGREQRQHQLMVLVGALAGLLLHVILVSFSAVSVGGSSIFNFIGVALLIVMGIILHLKLHKEKASGKYIADERDVRKEKETWNQFAPQPRAGAASDIERWNSNAFRAAPPSTLPVEGQQQGYGTVVAPPGGAASPEWAKDELRPGDEGGVRLSSLLLVGAMSMALIFVIEVGDRSQYSFLTSGRTTGASLIVSSMLGYTFATCIAVFVGYLLENMIDPKHNSWLLFAAEMGCFAMALVCLSQAVLGLSPLSIGTATAALLGIHSETHTLSAAL